MKKALLLLMILVTASSCQALLFKTIVVGKTGLNRLAILENPENGKEIIMIPMVHLEKPVYYEQIKQYLDSLKSNGYVVFYEGVAYSKSDSLSRDICDRKLRKIFGWHLTDYKDVNNNSGIMSIRSNKYVMQSLDRLGLITNSDVWVDLTVQQIVEKYEQQFGEVLLTDCDFRTNLNAKYRCKDTVEYDWYYAMQTVRDEYVIKKIIESDSKKIALVYGQNHVIAISNELSYSYGYKVKRDIFAGEQ